MKTESLLRQTRIRFPDLGSGEIKITPIEKGGSDRRFYRVRCSPEQSIILVKYNLDREENRHYVEIAQFLGRHGIRAPKIYHHDAEEGLIWIEDLGAADLWSYREETWLVRRSLYESALDEIAKLHELRATEMEELQGQMPPEFNKELYLWEQSYFFENCLGRVFNLDTPALNELASLPRLQEIADELASRPRVLVHRDFQSQNIIVRNAQAHLIDFQGMRPGLAEYDVASLLHDPYITLSEAECIELREYYETRRGMSGGDFEGTMMLCAMQRLMQALGAYGFLGLVKGNAQFLQHIPEAHRSLREVVEKIDGLEPLQRALGALS